jgi:hypothetical protein
MGCPVAEGGDGLPRGGGWGWVAPWPGSPTTPRRGRCPSVARRLPVGCPVRAKGVLGTSAHAMATYHPAASRLMVTVLGVPAGGRDQRTATRPSCASTSSQIPALQPSAVADLLGGERVDARAALESAGSPPARSPRSPRSLCLLCLLCLPRCTRRKHA